MSKNIWGGGANTNVNGLRFEKEHSLRDALEDNGYTISVHDPDDKHANIVYDVYDSGTLVGYTASKRALQSLLSEMFSIDMREVFSKNLEPDESFFNLSDGILHIVEKKTQESAGSVDEKLQTCAFKKRQYNKLAAADKTGKFKGTSYSYVLSDWFKRSEYDDVKEFIEEEGCRYFIGELPLSMLGLK